MLKNILVATDGSATAARAVDTAAALAAKFNARLTVVHVLMHGSQTRELERLADAEHIAERARRDFNMPSDRVPHYIGDMIRSVGRADESDRLIAAMGEHIAERAANAARRAGVKDVATAVPSGDYAEAILKAAEKAGADTIVIGRRGLGTLRGLLQGSVSQKINTLATGTVVTVA